MKKVELLAPAKNFKAIKAALKYADSIYFGVKELNMIMRLVMEMEVLNDIFIKIIT